MICERYYRFNVLLNIHNVILKQLERQPGRVNGAAIARDNFIGKDQG